jgi:hypothetical protein
VRVLDDVIFYCFTNSAFVNVADKLRNATLDYEYAKNPNTIRGDVECNAGSEAKLFYRDYVDGKINNFFNVLKNNDREKKASL